MAQRDPYEVLGVARNASADDLKLAYRRLARQYHPDVNPNDPAAEEKFKEIGQAYAVVGDPEKRARFDQFGVLDDQPAGPDFFAAGGGINDLFDMFFGGAAGGNAGRRQGRDGADLRIDLTITLGEVITGVKREVELTRLVACEACHGVGTEGGKPPDRCSSCNGQGVIAQTRNTFMGQMTTRTTCPNCAGAGVVIKTPCSVCRGRQSVQRTETTELDIPPGVESGATMHVGGRGNEGVGGGQSGDLYVVLDVKKDPRFERDRQTLVTNIDLTFAQAALGDELEIEGVDASLDLDIPAGTQPNAQIRIRGAGLPPLHGGRRGDLMVVCNVLVPKKLDSAQADLIRQLAAASGEELPKGHEKSSLLGGLFGKKH
ncbi:MAG: molecular chaperone DnaJ [Fimbriimonadaceae bacterium]